MRQLVHAGQMALFGPSPAERERYRRECREGRFGMHAREVMVRRKHWLIVEPEPEPRLENAWRPEPTLTQPPQPMHLHFAKPAKPFTQMTDAETEAFAHEMVQRMAERRTREAPGPQGEQK